MKGIPKILKTLIKYCLGHLFGTCLYFHWSCCAFLDTSLLVKHGQGNPNRGLGETNFQDCTSLAESDFHPQCVFLPKGSQDPGNSDAARTPAQAISPIRGPPQQVLSLGSLATGTGRIHNLIENKCTASDCSWGLRCTCRNVDFRDLQVYYCGFNSPKDYLHPAQHIEHILSIFLCQLALWEHRGNFQIQIHG